MKISTLGVIFRYVFWLVLFSLTINVFGNTTLHNCTNGYIYMTVNYQGKSGGSKGGEVLPGRTRSISLDCKTKACVAFCQDESHTIDSADIAEIDAGATDLYCFENSSGKLDVSGDASDC